MTKITRQFIKTIKNLGWKLTRMFKDGIRLTMQWYNDHTNWMNECTSSECQKYYQGITKNNNLIVINNNVVGEFFYVPRI